MTTAFERIVELTPAYDLTREGKGRRGAHCVDLRMVLKGPKGAIQFVLYTGWYLDGKVREPIPADLGYHSPVPMYEDQTLVAQTCEYLDGRACYYDGSTLNAERVFRVLLERGSDGVWEELEKEYKRRFERESEEAERQ